MNSSQENIMKIDNANWALLKSGIILLVVSALFVVSGCEGEKPATTKTIGIVLFGDSRMPQVNGFKDGLSRLGYKAGESIHYVVRNAKNKRPQLKSLVQELIDQDVDMLVAAGGLEADTMKKNDCWEKYSRRGALC
jgi:putative ABC transport system substrate-binding protein